jgi:hypothetical protein
MSVSRPLLALTLGGALLVPGLVSARQVPRLLLDPADTDHDGHVSDAERAASLALTTSDIAPVAGPADQHPRIRRVAYTPTPGPLDMARRVVPPTEFEALLEHRFTREVERRRKSKD